VTGRAHLILVLITLAALAFVVSLVRRRNLRAKYAMLWLGVGVLLLVVAALPRLLDWMAERIGIIYPPAAFLMLAVAFLFLVVIHFSYELSRLEERTRTLAEEVALLKSQQEQGPPSPAPPPAP
jgi:hypothetical protein